MRRTAVTVEAGHSAAGLLGGLRATRQRCRLMVEAVAGSSPTTEIAQLSEPPTRVQGPGARVAPGLPPNAVPRRPPSCQHTHYVLQ